MVIRTSLSDDRVVKRFAVLILSVLGGWLVASLAVTALSVVGLDVARAMATTYSNYRTYLGGEILIFTVVFGWLIYRSLARRVLGDVPDPRPFAERLPDWARHPTPVGVAVTWVVAVFTVLPYPLAAYMSWRLYANRRDATKFCPRCAERIKAAALVCRHCGASLVAPTPTTA